MALFYGWCSTASRLQSHYKETVYFSPLSPWENPGTHLINLKRMKGRVDPRAKLPQSTGFLTSDSNSDSITRDICVAYILGVTPKF